MPLALAALHQVLSAFEATTVDLDGYPIPLRVLPVDASASEIRVVDKTPGLLVLLRGNGHGMPATVAAQDVLLAVKCEDLRGALADVHARRGDLHGEFAAIAGDRGRVEVAFSRDLDIHGLLMGAAYKNVAALTEWVNGGTWDPRWLAA